MDRVRIRLESRSSLRSSQHLRCSRFPPTSSSPPPHSPPRPLPLALLLLLLSVVSTLHLAPQVATFGVAVADAATAPNKCTGLGFAVCVSTMNCIWDSFNNACATFPTLDSSTPAISASLTPSSVTVPIVVYPVTIDSNATTPGKSLNASFPSSSSSPNTTSSAVPLLLPNVGVIPSSAPSNSTSGGTAPTGSGQGQGGGQASNTSTPVVMGPIPTSIPTGSKVGNSNNTSNGNNNNLFNGSTPASEAEEGNLTANIAVEQPENGFNAAEANEGVGGAGEGISNTTNATTQGNNTEAALPSVLVGGAPASEIQTGTGEVAGPPGNNTETALVVPENATTGNSTAGNSTEENPVLGNSTTENPSAENSTAAEGNITVGNLTTGNLIVKNLIVGNLTPEHLATESPAAESNTTAGNLIAENSTTEGNSTAANPTAENSTAGNATAENITAGNPTAENLTTAEGNLTAAEGNLTAAEGNLTAAGFTPEYLTTENSTAGNTSKNPKALEEEWGETPIAEDENISENEESPMPEATNSTEALTNHTLVPEGMGIHNYNMTNGTITPNLENATNAEFSNHSLGEDHATAFVVNSLLPPFNETSAAEIPEEGEIPENKEIPNPVPEIPVLIVSLPKKTGIYTSAPLAVGLYKPMTDAQGHAGIYFPNFPSAGILGGYYPNRKLMGISDPASQAAVQLPAPILRRSPLYSHPASLATYGGPYGGFYNAHYDGGNYGGNSLAGAEIPQAGSLNPGLFYASPTPHGGELAAAGISNGESPASEIAGIHEIPPAAPSGNSLPLTKPVLGLFPVSTDIAPIPESGNLEMHQSSPEGKKKVVVEPAYVIPKKKIVQTTGNGSNFTNANYSGMATNESGNGEGEEIGSGNLGSEGEGGIGASAAEGTIENGHHRPHFLHHHHEGEKGETGALPTAVMFNPESSPKMEAALTGEAPLPEAVNATLVAIKPIAI